MLKTDIEELMELGMDIADHIVDTQNEAVDSLVDMLEEDHDIGIVHAEADDLIENIHSAVQEAVVAWCKEKLKNPKILWEGVIY